MRPADYIELCRLIGQDAIAMEAFWTPIKQRLPDGSVKLLNDRSFKTRKDLARVVWPDEQDMEERLQYVRQYVAAARGTGIGVILAGACIWQTLYEFVIGLHDCMIMMIEEPDLLDELMARSADYFAELVRRAIAEGVDLLLLADDFAFNKGMFVRPAQFERLWRPHFDRIMAPARSAGVPIIFHSDGKIDGGVEMLLDMGVSCLTPMDPSGIDYRDYKKRYGHRVCLHGNIDLTWPLAQGHAGGRRAGRVGAHGSPQARRPLDRRKLPQHRQLHSARELRRHDQRHPQARGVLMEVRPGLNPHFLT